jgi:hypothetical protein
MSHKKTKQSKVKKTFRAQAKPKRAKADLLPGAQIEHRKLIKSRNQPLTAQQRVEAALAATGAQIRYNQAGVRFDEGLRFVLKDPPVPVPGKAKVKLELNKRTASDLVGFAHSHEEAISGNPLFPTPQPTPEVFQAKLGELEAILTALENHRVVGKNLTTQRDAIRVEFEQVFTLRGNYVELTSEGNADWIASTGLPVKNPPTPTGILPWPLGLRADWTQLNGQLIVRWDAVTGAKSYLLEMAEVVNNVVGAWKTQYMGGKPTTLQSGLESGKTYAFRVAAVGGEGGMSAFGPEVKKAVA